MPETLLLPLAALPFPDIDPVIVRLGPLAIHWYGLAYVVGILFGWWYAKRLISTPHLWGPGGPRIAPQDIDDLLVWASLGIVLGGRVGYVLFYDFARYIANPLDALAIWQGGMSFHGGFLGATLAMVLFARARKLPVWSLFDLIAAGTPLALGVVRLTNFINSELWGRPTDLPWAIVFPNGGPEPRHPSQLYEAFLEGVLLLALLRIVTHVFGKLAAPGFVAGAFITGYGLCRIFVEFFREPDIQLGYLAGGWLTMGMVLSVPMLLAGIWAMATARRSAAAPAA